MIEKLLFFRGHEAAINAQHFAELRCLQQLQLLERCLHLLTGRGAIAKACMGRELLQGPAGFGLGCKVHGMVCRLRQADVAAHQLLASPDGSEGSLQLRQQVWLHHIELDKGEQVNLQLHGPRAYLQSIHGTVHAVTHTEEKEALTCGDGAFIRDEANITLVADTPLRALLIDLPV